MDATFSIRLLEGLPLFSGCRLRNNDPRFEIETCDLREYVVNIYNTTHVDNAVWICDAEDTRLKLNLTIGKLWAILLRSYAFMRFA